MSDLKYSSQNDRRIAIVADRLIIDFSGSRIDVAQSHIVDIGFANQTKNNRFLNHTIWTHAFEKELGRIIGLGKRITRIVHK